MAAVVVTATAVSLVTPGSLAQSPRLLAAAAITAGQVVGRVGDAWIQLDARINGSPIVGAGIALHSASLGQPVSVAAAGSTVRLATSDVMLQGYMYYAGNTASGGVGSLIPHIDLDANAVVVVAGLAVTRQTLMLLMISTQVRVIHP